MWALIRLAINFVIAALVLLGVNYLGWVHLHTPGVAAPTFGQLFVVALIIAGVFAVVKWLADIAFGLALVATCGLGCLLLPVYAVVVGYGVLWVMAQLLPRYLTLNTNPWLGILAGLVLGLFQVHAPIRVKHRQERWHVEWDRAWSPTYRRGVQGNVVDADQDHTPLP